MIVLEAVSKRYAADKPPVVDRVSLSVRKGEMLVLLGGSGSGKTTTLKMINRLIEPTAGRILIDGKDIIGADPVVLRRSIGYVFQGVGLFPHLTVAENVEWSPGCWGGPIAVRIEELLGLVQLDPASFRDRFPAALSGGQRQRVGFARALAAEPRILLLDEPFGALDPLTRDELRGHFLGLGKRLGLTGVMVTHDMTEALLSADRIAVLRAGSLVRIGSPRELIAVPGDPYVEELLKTPERHRAQLDALWARGDA